MKQSTLVAMKAILDSDSIRTKSDRTQLMLALGLEGCEKTAAEKSERIVSFEEAAERLACSKRTVHNIVNRGGLVKVRLPGSGKAHGFLASDVDALLALGKAPDVSFKGLFPRGAPLQYACAVDNEGPVTGLASDKALGVAAMDSGSAAGFGSAAGAGGLSLSRAGVADAGSSNARVCRRR